LGREERTNKPLAGPGGARRFNRFERLPCPIRA
jgi:hypothetical protein